MHAHFPLEHLPLAQLLPQEQEFTLQVPALTPEQDWESPQPESCIQVEAVQVPGASTHESLPHWLPFVHLHCPPLHVPPALQLLVQESGVQVPATWVPPQV